MTEVEYSTGSDEEVVGHNQSLAREQTIFWPKFGKVYIIIKAV